MQCLHIRLNVPERKIISFDVLFNCYQDIIFNYNQYIPLYHTLEPWCCTTSPQSPQVYPLLVVTSQIAKRDGMIKASITLVGAHSIYTNIGATTLLHVHLFTHQMSVFYLRQERRCFVTLICKHSHFNVLWLIAIMSWCENT